MESGMKRYRGYVKRTAASNEFRKDCERTNEYFKFWNLQTSKQKDWTCPEFYQSRKNKKLETEHNIQKAGALNIRRQKLSNMLYEENLALNEELQKKYGLNDLTEQQLKQKFDDLVAQKKKANKEEAEKMIQGEQAEPLGVGDSAKDSMKLDELKKVIAEEDAARNKEMMQTVINFDEAAAMLRDNENMTTSFLSQEAILLKMEQELFSIEEEKLRKLKKADDSSSVNQKKMRHIVLHLKQRGAQVLVEIQEEKTLIGKVQKACEQATLSDDKMKRGYDEVNNLIKLLDDQAEREKRVANYSANIFHEEANKELEACELRWSKEKSERNSKISQILADLQSHARMKRETVSLELQRLEADRKTLNDLLKKRGATSADMPKTHSTSDTAMDIPK
ncbi:trichoplein keratin filament-binding protein-like [Cloeon dipterum]|uniref:trichoplein keratin filament-binding protein-like n=1 Tax=Cloeon dipterum TaxID=197152 RepID=UPI00322041CD